MSARELKLGAYGGIAGGLIFGMMMGIYQASLDQLKQYAEKKVASAQVVN